MSDPTIEFFEALRQAKRARRRGDLRQTQAWLTIAERHIRLKQRLDDMLTAGDKHEAWRDEQPHRLKALDLRSRFPR